MSKSIQERLAELERQAARPTPDAPQAPFDYPAYRLTFLAFVEDWTAGRKPVVTSSPMMELLTTEVLR